MLNSWVLVLAVLGGACALPAPAPLAYTQALAQAVDSYNQRPEVQNAFRLLSADPEPAPGVDLSTLRVLNFSVMETECAPSAQVNPDDCDFKENGVIKECSGPVQFLQSSPEIDLTCTDASSNVSGEWGARRCPRAVALTGTGSGSALSSLKAFCTSGRWL
uniref:CTHL2 protein n=1 Tax=Strix occidentalis caurina TaxID=311401 RepID=A0A8D0EXT3_STROC